MSKYAIVVILSLGMTIIINMHITLKTSSNMVKTVWANCFVLIGMTTLAADTKYALFLRTSCHNILIPTNAFGN